MQAIVSFEEAQPTREVMLSQLDLCRSGEFIGKLNVLPDVDMRPWTIGSS
jgi:hypothetical protein